MIPRRDIGLVRESDAVWPDYVCIGAGPVTTLAVLRKFVGLYGWPELGVWKATDEEIADYLSNAGAES